MGRTKSVYDTGMIPHLFNAQGVDTKDRDIRNPQGNFHFRNHSVYSYRTRIGQLVDIAKRGKVTRVVLLNANTYSFTTNKHQWALRSATCNRIQFHVADMGPIEYRGEVLPTNQFQHDDNIARYRKVIADAVAKGMRATDRAELHYRTAKKTQTEAKAYCKAFSIRARVAIIGEAALRARVAKMETGRVARAERRAASLSAMHARQSAEWRERMAKQDADNAAWEANADRMANDWIASRNPSRDYRVARLVREKMQLADGFQAMALDRDKNEIVTTMQAVVPADHVRRIAPIVLRALDAGKTLSVPPDAPIRVGHFNLTDIDAQGNVTVGCHRFTAAEIRRTAATLASDAPDRADTIAAGAWNDDGGPALADE